MNGISERVMWKILADFPEPGVGIDVARQVGSASDDERVQAGIVIAAPGDLQGIQHGVELAALDWRDVIVNGGLADENWQAVLDLRFGPATGSLSSTFIRSAGRWSERCGLHRLGATEPA